ncbi:MAG: SDR family NAD(P)-dependent oxidoreductase [Rhizomicrobium sp.]
MYALVSAASGGEEVITDHLDFTGRVAIVTGGGTGIGFATARQFAKLGASVVIASRTTEELERSAASIREESGAQCLAVPTNVKDEDAVIRMVQRTVDEFNRVDILINNAGGTRMGPLAKMTTKAWDTVYDLNVRAAYFCTREVGEHMIAQRSGAIVNISSNAGMTGVKGGAHYSSAKAALQMFTTVTAAEWGRYGIRANCVAAGMISSPRAVDAWNAAGLDPNNMASLIPLRRPGTPDEIANMIVFFASDAASYITGQTVAVNGGLPMSGIPDD